MFRMSVNEEQKLVDVQLTGLVKAEEALRASNELKKMFLRFGPKQALLLVDLVGFAPMANDVLPIVRGMGRDVLSFFRKAALIQEFSMGFQGGRKVIEAPPGMPLPSFRTREEALTYLLED
jgi:hypothetical protein